ncbi:homeobox protein Hox-A9b-like [Saccoglossus kowalevskii]|uniref:Homeobox protein MOX-1-like n=1 Tax=Saccoglossus kowalevskii TaxID=10224 RepID=A0A0U2L5X4_SACKO|nr:PREDICTED: homeobox protein MOX-1-like [Saccoglossus kowalevskii]ALR88649.1 homeobox protein abdb-like [Saccoglossus kowalevskii]
MQRTPFVDVISRPRILPRENDFLYRIGLPEPGRQTTQQEAHRLSSRTPAPQPFTQTTFQVPSGCRDWGALDPMQLGIKVSSDVVHLNTSEQSGTWYASPLQFADGERTTHLNLCGVDTTPLDRKPGKFTPLYTRSKCELVTGFHCKRRCAVNAEDYRWLKPAVTSLVRKKRRPYSQTQILGLESEFIINSYLERGRSTVLAKSLNLTERQVKIWFQNRRMKEKRMFMREKLTNSKI